MELRRGGVERVILKGDYFGERQLMGMGIYGYDAVALEATELIAVSGEVFLPVVRYSRKLSRMFRRNRVLPQPWEEGEGAMSRLRPATLGRKVGELMRGGIATLSAVDTISAALAVFRKHSHTFYPVVDADGRLLGVVEREEIFDGLSEGLVDFRARLGEIELRQLPACGVDEEVVVAVEKMAWAGADKCLVCGGDGILEGMLTVMDLLGYEALEDARAANDVGTGE
jgi:CBS-domain-containing membrane protein